MSRPMKKGVDYFPHACTHGQTMFILEQRWGNAIYGCRVIQQEGQRPWVSMPQVEYQKNGHKKYFAVVKILDEKLKEDINDAILTAYKDGA